MPNPFTTPGATEPLRPWEYPEHEHYYADVDDSNKSYAAFCQYASKVNVSMAGFLALVYGKAGCGKSALINRAAHWVEDNPPTSSKLVLVVDLSGEAEGAAVESKIQSQCLVLPELLYNSEVITDAEFEGLNQRTDRLPKFFSFLEVLLKKKRLVLVLIQPRVELRQEFEAYQATWRRRNMICLCETDDDELLEYAEKAYSINSGKPVLCLRVGSLKAHDGWKFVQTRLNRWQQENNEAVVPSVTENVLKEYMRERLENGSHTSVRELHVTCFSVFERAIMTASPSVELTDFALHYMRLGRL